MKYWLGLSFVILVGMIACSDDGSHGAPASAVEISQQSEEAEPQFLPASDKELLNFFPEGSCPSKDLWVPQYSSAQEALEKSGIEFLIEKEAMNKLINNYGFFFTTTGELKLSKIDIATYMNLQIRFTKMEATRVCIRSLKVPYIFEHPNGTELEDIIEINIEGKKVPMGQLRYVIRQERAYDLRFRDGRISARKSWFSHSDVDEMISQTPVSQDFELKELKEKVRGYLKMMSFDISEEQVVTYFEKFPYRLTKKWFSGSRNGISGSEGLLLSQPSLEALLHPVPYLGDQAFQRIQKDHFIEMSKLIARLMQFHDGFAGIQPFLRKEEFPGYVDLPNTTQEYYDFHYWYFLVDLVPEMESLLLQECYDKYLKPHEALYCDLLKKQVQAEGKNWDQFVEEKYSPRRSFNRLKNYISLEGRRLVTKTFLQSSKTLIEKIWPLKRKKIQDDIDFAQSSYKLLNGNKEALDQIGKLLVEMQVLEASMEGQIYMGQLMEGEITEEEFQKKIEGLPDKAKADILAVHQGMNQVNGIADDLLDEPIESYLEKANQVNPFNNPFDHMK